MNLLIYFGENFNYTRIGADTTQDEPIVFFENSHECSNVYDSVSRNCELAFNTASEKLGIPALLDAEDIVRFEDPDPLSIMTYLSLVYHAFTSTSGRRARSVSRSRARAGAMDRLMDEARRARSVSSARSGEIRQPAAERAASPPLEMENPFKLLGAETEPEIKQTRESLVTRRSKRRSQEPQMRVRSLFIDNLDRELPTLMEDTRDTRPRHVLSYSSYAMPYRSTGCLASSSMVEGLQSLGSEVSLESEVRAGHSRKNSKSKAIVSFVKSKLGRLNSNSEKRKSSQNFFESKLHASENIKHTIS